MSPHPPPGARMPAAPASEGGERLSSLLQVPPASFSHPSHKTFQGCWSHRLDPFLPNATSDQDKTAQDPRGSKALLTKLRVLGYLIPMDQVNHCQSD